MLRPNRRFNQFPEFSARYGCYVVTVISINCQDAMDATFQQPSQSTGTTLWMPGGNIYFKQFRGRFGCYVVTVLSTNHQDCNILFSAISMTLWMLRSNNHFNQLAGRYGCYVVTPISRSFQDAMDVASQQPCQSTWRVLWMLPCNIPFKHLRRRFGGLVVTTTICLSWEVKRTNGFVS